MKTQFGDVGDDNLARGEKIRALFRGGRTIKAHTAICVAAQVWTEAELLAKAERACSDEVREALGVLRDGLPWAGPTKPRKDARPVWKQIELWTREEYVYNYDGYKRRGGENVAIANNIATQCAKVWGSGPSLLMIIEAEESEE